MNEPKRRGRPPKVQPEETVTHGSDAQSYALRVWNGQSVNVPYGERRWRVQKALEAQGMTMDGVTLPEAE
jgi:hypothetical protein